MAKFVLELALFICILCQIHILATRTDAAAPVAQGVSMVALAGADTLYGSALKDMARREAERIVQTGDYQTFQHRIEKASYLYTPPVLN